MNQTIQTQPKTYPIVQSTNEIGKPRRHEIIETRAELEVILTDLIAAQETLEGLTPYPEDAVMGVCGARVIVEKMLRSTVA